jgi:superfamily II DNA/RNA helicase
VIGDQLVTGGRALVPAQWHPRRYRKRREGEDTEPLHGLFNLDEQ